MRLEAFPDGIYKFGGWRVWAEQAVFTSLVRRGRGGYHVVSRSRGVDESDAQALARWAPSHGALIVDGNNRTSVNFHTLPSGRFALSRTCAGPPEYSGRGGHQLYTHFLIVDDAALESVGFHPFSIYRDAMALGCLLYQLDPKEVLEPVRLSQLHPRRDASFWADRARELGFLKPRLVVDRLLSGQPARVAYTGDRAALGRVLDRYAALTGRARMPASPLALCLPRCVPFALSLVGAEYNCSVRSQLVTEA